MVSLRLSLGTSTVPVGVFDPAGVFCLEVSVEVSGSLPAAADTALVAGVEESTPDMSASKALKSSDNVVEAADISILSIRTEQKGRTSFALGVDNQAALTAAATPGNRSGHHLANIFLTTAINLRKSRGARGQVLTDPTLDCGPRQHRR